MKKSKRRSDLRHMQCFYCGAPPPSTIDHYMPRALGGSNNLQNLRPACANCNMLKADMHPDDWVNRLQQERRGIRKIG